MGKLRDDNQVIDREEIDIKEIDRDKIVPREIVSNNHDAANDNSIISIWDDSDKDEEDNNIM